MTCEMLSQEKNSICKDTGVFIGYFKIGRFLIDNFPWPRIHTLKHFRVWPQSSPRFCADFQEIQASNSFLNRKSTNLESNFLSA